MLTNCPCMICQKRPQISQHENTGFAKKKTKQFFLAFSPIGKGCLSVRVIFFLAPPPVIVGDKLKQNDLTLSELSAEEVTMSGSDGRHFMPVTAPLCASRI